MGTAIKVQEGMSNKNALSCFKKVIFPADSDK
jgi:hypothetical protein